MEQEKIIAKASVLADQAAAAILEARGDGGKIERIFQDLKRKVCDTAAELIGPAYAEYVADPEILLWDFAKAMPDFDLAGLSQARLNWISLGAAVVAGWVLGGFLSTFLGVFSLGGDILRAGCIFAAVWLEDYLASSATARRRFLKCAGWLSLAGFAARLGSGFFRLGEGLKGLIFGAARPGIFKSAWLLLGAGVIFVFFSRKSSLPDADLLKNGLRRQIAGRLGETCVALERITDLSRKVNGQKAGEGSSGARYCPRNECVLAEGIYAVLDNLPDGQRQYVRDRLELAGYKPDEGAAFGQQFIWNEQEHSARYDKLGFIRDGDRCVALKRPVLKDGVAKRGLAQAVGRNG